MREKHIKTREDIRTDGVKYNWDINIEYIICIDISMDGIGKGKLVQNDHQIKENNINIEYIICIDVSWA
jgi:hypothetical protein